MMRFGTHVTMLLLCFCATTGFLSVRCAQAADTVEPFVKGASNYELYGGVAGLGCGKTITGETIIGFGLTDRIDSTVVLHTVSSPQFITMESGFSFGLFGNLMDTRHFDLDLYFSFGSDGSVTPGVEVNLDLEQDLRMAGLYVRVNEQVAGEARREKAHRSFTTMGVLGAYYTVSPHAQILGELHLRRGHGRLGDGRLRIAGAALGLNIQIHKRLELISQIIVSPASQEHPRSFGLSTGILVTME